MIVDADEYYNLLDGKQRIINSAFNNHQVKVIVGSHSFFEENRNLDSHATSLKEAKKMKLNFNGLFKKASK